jgi:hypothetical protein
MAALGATTFYANRSGLSGSSSKFSIALAGGMKYFLTRNFGFRGEVRWSPTVIAASDSDFWCSIGGLGAACTANLKVSLQEQMDLSGGIIFRF